MILEPKTGIHLSEAGGAGADSAGYGQIWIKNDTINQDDSGHLDFTEDDSAFNTDGGYGFRIQLDGDTPNGKGTLLIQSGNQTTINNRMAIVRDTGNVGIGLTDPDHKLEISSTSYDQLHLTRTASDANVDIKFTNDQGSMYAGMDYTDTLLFGIGTGADQSADAKFVVESSGNVGIGTTSPNTAVILDLSSTSKAFRPPVMTTTQRDAISSPAEGSVIYNTTTNVLNFHNGSAWAAV